MRTALRQMALSPEERVTLAKRALGASEPPAFLDDKVLLRLRELGFLRVVNRKPRRGDMIASNGERGLVVVEVTETGWTFARGGVL